MSEDRMSVERSINEVVEFGSKVPGFYDRDELEQLAKLVKRLPKQATIVEIGVEFGRSASVYLQLPEHWSELHLIDDRSINAVPARRSLSMLLGCFQWGGEWDRYEPKAVISNGRLPIERPRSLGCQRREENRIYDREVTSKFAADEWEIWPNKPIDLLHIDADHGEGVWRDCELWLPKVAVGGFVVFHDYMRKGADGTGDVFPEVTKAVDVTVIYTDEWRLESITNTQLSARRIA